MASRQELDRNTFPQKNGNGHLSSESATTLVRDRVPEEFRHVLDVSKKDIEKLFDKPIGVFYNEWQQEPTYPDSYSLNLEIFRETYQSYLLGSAMQEMVNGWAKEDLAHDETTNTYTLKWDRITPIASVNTEEAVIEIKLGENPEETMLRLNSIIGALIPSFNKLRIEEEAKYNAAKRELAAQNERDYEFVLRCRD